MSDPKDELRARFDEQADADETPTETDTTTNSGSVEQSNNSGNSNNTGNVNNPNNSSTTENTHNTDNPGDSSGTETPPSTETTPGPSKDTTATRHRRQIPMYLPEEKATALNDLYERIDARSKIAGDGGIEKHADFMEQLVEFAIENESELAAQLGVEP